MDTALAAMIAQNDAAAKASSEGNTLAASREQSSGAEQIGKAVVQLDTVIQQNASASEELASMAEELSSQAEALAETLTYFRLPEGLLSASAARDASRSSRRHEVRVAHAAGRAARADAAGPAARPSSTARSLAAPQGPAAPALPPGASAGRLGSSRAIVPKGETTDEAFEEF